MPSWCNAVGVVLLIAQGRLVPRQPWAIKRTTPAALRHEGIFIAKYILWNIGMTLTALHRYNIRNEGYIHWNIGTTPTALCIRIFVTANRFIRAIDVVED